LIELFNEDCMEGMKRYPDKYFDLCLTDPPYGLNIDYKSYIDTQENLSYLISKVMPEIMRISKRVVITCGVQNVFLYPPSDWIICWYYGTTNTYGKIGFNSWQPVLFYGDDPYLKNRMGAVSDVIIDSKTPESNDHPCPKSISFWNKILIRATAKLPSRVIDPFLGSGTTAIACYNLDFDLTGFEIDIDYYNGACNRLEEHRKQGRLFDATVMVR